MKFAIQCIAYNGSQIALFMLDVIRKKHKSRKLKKAAAETLEYMKIEFKMSNEDFEDLLIPSFGFSKDRKRVFSYGEREFTVVLMTDLTLAIYEEEKLIKSLPKASEKKKDKEELVVSAKEEYQSMKKQIKVILDSQKSRLERAVYSGRKWNRDKWVQIFV